MINLGNLVKANDTPYLVQLNQVTSDLRHLFCAGSKSGSGATALCVRAAQSSGLSERTIGQSGRRPVDFH